MADSADSYSRAVAWLKILLPLAALAVLSTLFLFSRRIDPMDAIPYAEVDIEELTREPRLTEPRYSGVTEDGAALTVSAAEARPDPSAPQKATARGLSATIETPDGGLTEVEAAEGSIDNASRSMTLGGGVVLRSSSGYTVRSEALTSALDATRVDAAGGVTAEGPAGTFSAAEMHLQREPGDKGAYVLVFNGGVKLIYDPKD